MFVFIKYKIEEKNMEKVFLKKTLGFGVCS